jgi:hypothetical protein
MGCTAFRVAYEGCAINPEGVPHFFVDDWIRRAERAVHGSSLEMQSPAAWSTVEQLLYLAKWTRRT